jgi:hypothetical protein
LNFVRQEQNGKGELWGRDKNGGTKGMEIGKQSIAKLDPVLLCRCELEFHRESFGMECGARRAFLGNSQDF